MARDGAGAGRARRRRGRGHRPQRSDARTGRAGRARPRDPPRDPLERRPHGRRVRRDRGAGRARAADRADRQPRADRASPRPSCCGCARHEPEHYARIARIMLPKDYVRLRLCGEHAIDMADASGTLLLDVARPALERRGARRARARPGLAAAAARVAGGLRADAGRRRGRGRRGRPGGGRARRRGRPARARSRSRSARAASCSPRCPAFAADDRGARARVLPCRPGRLARDGRDALRRRLAALAARRRRARHAASPSSSRRRRRGSPAPRASTFLPYLAGERTPHADPDARGSFTGLSLRHDRGALTRAVLEGVAYGLRDSLDLLRELGRRARARPRLGRRRALGAVAPDHRLRARAAARAPRRRGGRRLRRRAARRRRGRHVARHGGGGGRDACARAARSSPSRPGSRPTPRAASASARSTPRCARSAEPAPSR